MTQTYTATARPWPGGWELLIEQGGATQSRTLAGAEHMVRDYIRLARDVPADSINVVIIPVLGGQVLTGPAAEELAEVERRAARRGPVRVALERLTGHAVA